MKRFKDKTSKFGSLICLIALSAMLMLFFAQLPVFLESTTGQLFAGFWGLFALIMFVAHVLRLAAERQRHAVVMPLMARTKDARTRKGFRRVRAMRG